MTVPNTYTPAQYNCNGSTVAFPFTFGVGATSEIEVILTDANGVETILTETTHYTVSAVNNDYESGGTVTTVATYASGNKITIRINVPLTQDTDFVEGMPTLYESFENGLDKLTRIAQQLSEGRERALIVPKTESASISREIPDAATRASKLLGFDASGEPVAVTDVEGITLTTFGNALVSSNDADEARTTLETPTTDFASYDEKVSPADDDLLLINDSAENAIKKMKISTTLMLLTGANLAIGSDADGDMYYRASSVLARLAKGAANTHLIMNAGATAPEWAAGVKIGASSRTGDAASGDVAYTGVGFKPSNILFFGAYSGGTPMCIGLDDATIHRGVFDNYQNNNNAWGAVNYCLNFAISPGTYQQAIVKTLDADGFTLTWTKTGSPAAAACTFYYICFR